MWWRQVVLVAMCAALVASLRCWKCGQYSDGVGSITPCTNATGATHMQCAQEHKHCIKYVSELTTVRDCVPTCTEKEWWGARTYCCDTDDCNSAGAHGITTALIIATTVFLLI